jgi:hypothetical protein
VFLSSRPGGGWSRPMMDGFRDPMVFLLSKVAVWAGVECRMGEISGELGGCCCCCCWEALSHD